MSTHRVTLEDFLLDVDRFLDSIQPGNRIEIWVDLEVKFVLIHPVDIRHLDECVKTVDNL